MARLSKKKLWEIEGIVYLKKLFILEDISLEKDKNVLVLVSRNSKYELLSHEDYQQYCVLNLSKNLEGGKIIK